MTRPKIKLAVSIQIEEKGPRLPVGLLEGSFEEKLDKAANLGADGVELVSSCPQDLDFGCIRAALERAGLEACAIASGGLAFLCGRTLLNADQEVALAAQANLKDLIHFAAQVGAKIVTVGSFRGRAAWAGEQATQTLARILGEGAAYAGSYGVKLAIEPLNRYETDIINNVEQGLGFLDLVQNDWLGLLLDTYHVNIEEASWSQPFIRAAEAGKLFHVHVGDNNRLYPGGGLIDFYQILAALQQVHYQGYVSAELLPYPTPDLAAKYTLSKLRSILEKLP